MIPPGGRIVWLASYPKSGNTWLRFLIANYLSDDAAPLAINRINLNSPYPVMKDFLEDESFIDADLLRLDEANILRASVMEDYAQRCDTVNCIKVHDRRDFCVNGAPLLGWGELWSGLYIVRDPRDVAVSMTFHNNITVDGAIRMLNNPDNIIGWSRNGRHHHVPQRVGDWSAHVASWIDQTDFPVHFLRYEDLQADPVGVFGAAVAFTGLEVQPARVERAVRFADFRELQRQESQSGFFERPSNSAAPFFRSGRVGAWAEVLSKAQSDTITAAHRPMMERCGYL
ncbi:sulfotransferase domain-containing protein [Niveispirillum sp. SYP-B3756]|uniref:sulfotransferase domain-containing protein n=1 Tax=Niveispirillum sp. SYP-B3756 TaxID=2662178 RepID=UPI0012916339|nr:sulfotransferase domain-containing protein [Niveispirillum sp. SYP-B3756]MQP65968.1 sulfotransferase domain-containing protein [Niveispirillum sp. SYP-B3756]